MDGFGDTHQGIKPKFDSGLGYLILLDNIIKLANGYYISEMMEEYHRCLESWYMETIERFERMAATDKKKSITKKTIEELKTLRAAAQSSKQEEPLKNYQMELNRLTHLCGLRLKDVDTDPGDALE
ncbi:MAG: hypothetical protein KAU20_07895 [Nanoarchaeota archaeon]|nr:hypothetical protein [Nanoarchaeota archaeon]